MDPKSLELFLVIASIIFSFVSALSQFCTRNHLLRKLNVIHESISNTSTPSVIGITNEPIDRNLDVPTPQSVEFSRPYQPASYI